MAEWGASPAPGRASGIRPLHLQHPPDGSGIGFSSRLRPILTMRPGFLTFDDARGSGLRHFPADSHFSDWLEAKGIAFDVITDEDLDEEGSLLAATRRGDRLAPRIPHAGHARRAAGLRRWRRALAYLGGNGFYWKVARAPGPAGRDRDPPRRGRHPRLGGGARRVLPPARRHLGGLWRRNGRPPQRSAASASPARAPSRASHYRRLPAPRTPAWPGSSTGGRGRVPRRLRPVRRRRGGLRAGPRRPAARHAAQRGDPGRVGAAPGPLRRRCRRNCCPMSPPSPASGRRR